VLTEFGEGNLIKYYLIYAISAHQDIDYSDLWWKADKVFPPVWKCGN